jgi:DNA-binding response OmpR family regulator
MQYNLADLAIDTGRQQVTRGTEPLPLPKLSFDLLLAFVQAAPNVVSLDELITPAADRDRGPR